MRVFLGEINSTREDKWELPMLGGFLTIENFNIEQKQRTASGKLIFRKVASKRRLVFEFDSMTLYDFWEWEWLRYWTTSQRVEFEYEEKDGTFSTVVVDSVATSSHTKSKTNPANQNLWVISQTTFTFEEV